MKAQLYISEIKCTDFKSDYCFKALKQKILTLKQLQHYWIPKQPFSPPEKFFAFSNS